MSRLEEALRRLARDLADVAARWAVIGGVAVSSRAEPRTTRDVDLAIAVDSDEEAEALVRTLLGRGYQPGEEGVLENLATKRLATVRLVAPGEEPEGIVVDLMFDSSCIEAETIATATPLDVFPGLVLPVASIAHLLALKLLAGRAQDIADAAALLAVASAADLDAARQACELIATRGCHRDRDLGSLLERLVGGLPIEVVG